MGIGWSNRKPNPIAIDFGSETVRLLQLSEDARPGVIGSASIRVPLSARCDAATYFNFVGQHLKPAMRGVGFKGRRAVASISSFLTYVQHVRIGKCAPEQLEETIKLELSGRIPLDPETMVVRHVSVGEIYADGQQKQEVICLAASRESVFGCVELAKTAGLDIVGMHGEPMATLEAFTHLFRRDDDREQATLFVDLGATTTNAAISHGPRLVFAKTVHVGIDHFIRQFATHGEINEEQAGEMWLQQAIASQHGGQVQGADEQTGGVATALAQAPSVGLDGDALETITDDLQLCLGYHASMFEGRAVSKVIFSGGGSGHRGLCQRIAQTLCLPAQLGDPTARLAPGGADDGVLDITRPEPGWAVAMGLSMLPTNL